MTVVVQPTFVNVGLDRRADSETAVGGNAAREDDSKLQRARHFS